VFNDLITNIDRNCFMKLAKMPLNVIRGNSKTMRTTDKNMIFLIISDVFLKHCWIHY
jgi:hypothetical protein